MSKSEALRIYRKHTDAIPYHVDRVLHAIIDALPDEPEKPVWVNTQIDCEKPVEVKESQPTSALSADEAREYMGKAQVESSVCIAQNEQMISLLGEIRDALGQRSDPPAPSQAQPPKEVQNPSIWDEPLYPSDARKLRIMKAMEDIAKKDPSARFSNLASGVWTVVYPSGAGCVINEWYSPKQPAAPLWEGELLVNSKSPEEFGKVYGGWEFHQQPTFGWRRIKVREVRS